MRVEALGEGVHSFSFKLAALESLFRCRATAAESAAPVECIAATAVDAHCHLTQFVYLSLVSVKKGLEVRLLSFDVIQELAYFGLVLFRTREALQKQ